MGKKKKIRDEEKDKIPSKTQQYDEKEYKILDSYEYSSGNESSRNKSDASLGYESKSYEDKNRDINNEDAYITASDYGYSKAHESSHSYEYKKYPRDDSSKRRLEEGYSSVYKTSGYSINPEEVEEGELIEEEGGQEDIGQNENVSYEGSYSTDTQNLHSSTLSHHSHGAGVLTANIHYSPIRPPSDSPTDMSLKEKNKKRKKRKRSSSSSSSSDSSSSSSS